MRLFFSYIIYLTTFVVVQAQEKGDKNILLLNSYHVGYQWTDDVTRGVRDAIVPNNKAELFVEYLDSKRFEGGTHFSELVNLYKNAYSKINIDGIICSDNYAFEFYLKEGDNIWGKNIPVTFCGVNNIDNYQYNTQRIKGIREDIDVKRTLDLLYSLQPNTDSLIVITDNTLSGFFFRSRFDEELKQYNAKIPCKILDGSDYRKIKDKLKQLSPENKAIILLSLYSKIDDVPVSIKNISSELFKDIEIPIYSFWDFLLDDFITGGSVISGFRQGYKAAELLTNRIDKPHLHFPDLMATSYHATFDYNILNKYHLNSGQLPKHTTFINKQIPFYIRYNKQFAFFLGALILLLVIIIVLIRNIAKRQSIERKLLESEERLELALNGANEGMWDIQLPTRKIVYSKNYALLLGYQSTKDLALDFDNWHKQFRAADVPKMEKAFLLHLNGDTPVLKLELPMRMQDGSFRYFSIQGKVTEYDINNAPVRITGITKDISSRKEFERQLKIAKEKAEESDRLKSSFLANMSHEIRTPMNAILGFSDILINYNLSPSEIKDYLSQIKNSGENLLNIINDIVDFSRIESGQLTIRKERFDLNKLLTNVMYAGKTLIKTRKKNITLSLVNATDQGAVFINSDPYRLEQILLNLISNAVKFTNKGGIVLKYHPTHNGLLTFIVSDTGQGITSEDQKIIFERFRQANNTQTLPSGTGLGLSITRSLVHLLGGSIWVESELKKGSVFSFTIRV
ncbi:PAS fold-containing protein [Saccharicrinis carchari]|uniref:histidine kinase n=1 Tax=Saccharicrinis carchari TaxID=1168039 RepID=A0A521DMY2_SACCC|nr:PAS domain-containing protein [Saccharicrinis carchari]SMO73053.1 PAS fold-containing protein [Saccharicrinis carchari]